MLVLSTGLLPEEPCQCGRENGRGQRRSLEADVRLHSVIGNSQDTEHPGTLWEEPVCPPILHPLLSVSSFYSSLMGRHPPDYLPA